MDELDLLKSHWQKDDIQEKQLSSKDIYPLLLKKSSSIVKTLFYISIVELVFFVFANSILPMLLSDSYSENIDVVYGNPLIMKVVIISGYFIIIPFVYFLYKSYKSISVTDNAKKLMESILKTRKVIKYYVAYNMVLAFVAMIIAFYFAVTRNSDLMLKLDGAATGKIILLVAIAFIITAGFVFIIWLFYKLLYGILLKRLNRNYEELKKLEV